jgi:hypothetical protein
VLIWSTLRKVSVQVMPTMPRDNTTNTAQLEALVLASQTFRSLAPADTVTTVTVTLTMPPAPLSPSQRDLTALGSLLPMGCPVAPRSPSAHTLQCTHPDVTPSIHTPQGPSKLDYIVNQHHATCRILGDCGPCLLPTRFKAIPGPSRRLAWGT